MIQPVNVLKPNILSSVWDFSAFSSDDYTIMLSTILNHDFVSLCF